MKVVGLRCDGRSRDRYRRLRGYAMDHETSDDKLLRSKHVFAIALPIVLAAALAWWAASPSIAQTADGRTVSPLERTVDASITPGDDFFGYANGSWLRTTTLAAGSARWSARDELEEQARRRIAALLDDAATAPAGSAARKVADFRAAYLNEAAIESRGLASLKPLLDRVDRVSDKTELTRLLGRSMRADVDPMGFGVYKSASVLGLAVQQSIHGEKNNVAFLVQGGLGLPDRDDYIDAAKVARYRAYIASMLTLAHFDNGGERATAVLALETAIAQTQGTREASGNDRNADNVWTRADFASRAPGMDWTVFFDAAQLSKERDFAVWQPTAVTGVAALVASQPLDAWKDYLRFHAIHEFADVLPRAFGEQSLAFRAAMTSAPQPSRAERALAATKSAMPDAIGRMYVKRY